MRFILLILLLTFSLNAHAGQVEDKLYQLCKNRGLQWSALIKKEAHRFLLHPVKLATVIALESSCNYMAKSRVGAIGLGQILPKGSAAVGFPEYMLVEPTVNVYLTARHLAKLLILCKGSWLKAVAVYNGYSKCRPTDWSKHVISKMK